MRARTRSQRTLPYWILAIAGLSGIVGIAYVGLTAEERPQLHGITRCPADAVKHPLTRKTVVVIDRSEALNDIQQRDVLNSLDRELTPLPREQIIVYELLGSADLQVKPILERCNPVQPATDSLAAKLEKDEALELKEFREKFLQHVQRAVANALDIRGAADSPIMELIQAVAIRDLKSAPPPTARRLILISDLMQNSRGFSQYGRTSQDAFFQHAFQSFRTDLARVNVLVLYIRRTSGASMQPDGHKAFWEKYFALQGAQVAFVDIEGAAWSAHKRK